jgi:hypothetical protein
LGKCAHHSNHPFSTREVLATISSPLRVCLTPWSVFQDGWRHPIFNSPTIESTEKLRGRCEQSTQLYLSSFHRTPFHTCYRRGLGLRGEKCDRAGVDIKWRHFHCHCHDFRFYVTLFPKCFSNFRSRYLFTIGLPNLYLTLADTYLPLNTVLPNSATRFEPYNEISGGRLNGLTPPLAQYSHEGFDSTMGLLCNLNFTDPENLSLYGLCHNSRPLRPDSASSSIPLRSPLTKGITVVFFSSAE